MTPCASADPHYRAFARRKDAFVKGALEMAAMPHHVFTHHTDVQETIEDFWAIPRNIVRAFER